MSQDYEKNVRLRGKGQITIPAEILRTLDLKANDNIKLVVEDGRIVLIPTIQIAKDQAWYWGNTWQQAEREADSDIRAGRTSGPMSAEDAIAWLDNDEIVDGVE